MNKDKINAVQEWLPFERILSNGIIKLDSYSYIKIIQVKPINFNLKSELEKEAILRSYNNFLKSCNFDLQILIQSNKENLSNIISKINIQKNNEKENIKKIANEYINYLIKINKNKKSSNKNFFIIIKNNKNYEKNKTEEIIIEELNDKYYKIKECLSRCGNFVTNIKNKENIKYLLFSFINRRMYDSEN